MKSSLFSLFAGTALALGLGFGGTAHAQGTWQLGGSSCNVITSNTPDNAVCAVGGVTATMSAWGGSGSAFTQHNLGENDPSGFGAITGVNETSTNGHHGFDNQTTNCGSGTATTGCGGAQEFMLISFGSAKVNLSALSIGYSFADADISVYRWDGNSAANAAGGTAAAGWSLVAAKDMNGSNNSGGVGSFDVNNETGAGVSKNSSQLDKYSSWWLISTYAGGFTNGNLGGQGAWKLQSFTAGVCVGGTITGGSTGGGSTTNNNNGSTCTTTPGGAPEPGSLALAGLALVGVFAARRRPVATLRAA